MLCEGPMDYDLISLVIIHLTLFGLESHYHYSNNNVKWLGEHICHILLFLEKFDIILNFYYTYFSLHCSSCTDVHRQHNIISNFPSLNAELHSQRNMSFKTDSSEMDVAQQF